MGVFILILKNNDNFISGYYSAIVAVKPEWNQNLRLSKNLLYNLKVTAII